MSLKVFFTFQKRTKETYFQKRVLVFHHHHQVLSAKFNCHRHSPTLFCPRIKKTPSPSRADPSTCLWVRCTRQTAVHFQSLYENPEVYFQKSNKNRWPILKIHMKILLFASKTKLLIRVCTCQAKILCPPPPSLLKTPNRSYLSLFLPPSF